MKYALIDTANTFFRARHIASRNSDTWEKIGMAIHLTLASTNSIANKFGIDHVVFCLEGRSWRKDIYPQYKAHRAVARQAATEAEKEENEMFWETYGAFTEFLQEKTNCSVLRHPEAEADDLIARFIHLHPNDTHYIISSDTDYVQLINSNVYQYNGISGELIKPEGYFNDKGVLVKDKKTKEPKLLEDPQYLLFKKCLRGDSSDNVFSAFPGIREKGSSKKAGIKEAFEDKEKQGFVWNNVMLSRWTDHNNVEHRVLDDYKRNVTLIDLTAQPDDIKASVDATILEGVRVNTVPQVGVHLMRFTAKHELTKINEQAETYSKWLNAPYPGKLHVKDPS
jgi:5'-3' exonuclease